ncbi:MAG: hypothetical protein K8R86_12405 [Bacteroidales bacterium]|nr:hypothetical protein [Bacteroidales bacterium]
METLIINIDNPDNVQVFLELIRKLDFVKSIKTASSLDEKENDLVKEPVEGYNWIAPDRPASESEIDKLIAEMDIEETNGKYLNAKEAKARTLQKLEEWQKKQM